MRSRINTKSSRALRSVLLPIVLIIVLSSTFDKTLLAAVYEVHTSGDGIMGCDNKPKAGNPYAGDGLQATASDACDWSVSGYEVTYSGSASAGAYGSDTSFDARMFEAFDQVCVEPMADSTASASCSGSCGGFIKCSHSTAYILVNHRVGDNPGNPIPGFPNLDEILNNIHIQISYRIGASHNCATGFGSVTSYFGVSGCTDSFYQLFTSPVQINDIWKGTIPKGCVLMISAQANTDACTEAAPDCTAHVSVDPFMQIDPTWEYAQYFIAEQESMLVPGEWKEVTRDWKYFCECDLEPDGDVDGSNLYAFMEDFGRSDCSEGCPGDLDGDGKVDEADLILFEGDFGKVNCKNLNSD